jgi:hypothetical protein
VQHEPADAFDPETGGARRAHWQTTCGWRKIGYTSSGRSTLSIGATIGE